MNNSINRFTWLLVVVWRVRAELLLVETVSKEQHETPYNNRSQATPHNNRSQAAREQHGNDSSLAGRHQNQRFLKVPLLYL